MKKIILALLCLCASFGRAQSNTLAVTYGTKGIQTIAFNNVTLEDVGTYSADVFHIWHLKSTDLSGTLLTTGGYGWGETNTGESWNSSTNTETYTFAWGSIATQFVQSGNNLNINVTETNNSGSGAIIDGAEIYPFALHFPTDPFSGYSQYAITTTGPGVSAADFGSGIATAVIPVETTPLYTGWKNISSGVYSPIMTSTAPDGLASFLPHNDVPVSPGQTLSYTISIRFTAEGTSASATDAYSSFAAKYPSQMTWNDHRIIGTAYLASSPPCSSCDITQPGGFPTNPRRYFNDSTVDITTSAGRQAFQNRVLAQAASTVTTAQNLTAQGVITWDIEGEPYPQDTSYVCSPDQIATVAPEMENTVLDSSSPYYGQKLDDAYFATIAAAGLKNGVCLRPQSFAIATGGTASQSFLTTNAAIVSNLETKANFAHSRWGVTIFYVDSTVDVNGGTLDPAIFQQLITDLPNFLFIPEESTPRYNAYSAPFHSFIFHTDYGTDPSIYNVYPNAFGAILINDVSSSTLSTYTPQLTASSKHGDILMAHSTDYNANNPTILSIYQTANAAAPTPIHSASAGASGSAYTTVNITSPTPSNTLLAEVFYFGSDTLTIPSGWSAAGGSCPQYGGGNAICVLYRPVTAGMPTSYTFTESGADGISAIIYEIRGGATAFINAIAAASGGSGPLTSPTVTPNVIGTLPIAACSPSNGTMPTAPSGWTIDQTATASNYHSAFSMHRNTLTSDTSTSISVATSISPTVSFSGCTTILIAPGVTANPNPVAYIAASNSPIVNVPFSFDGSGSYDPNAETLTYAWNFGDGGTATGSTPTHTYSTTGTYTTALVVTNTNGLTGSASVSKTVQPTPPPTASVVGVTACNFTTNSAVVTCAPSATIGHKVTTLFSYSYTNGDYDYVPFGLSGTPDVTWSSIVSGRSGASLGGQRMSINTHIVAPGDPSVYSFFPSNATGQNVVAYMIETINTDTPQVACNLVSAQSTSQSTPPLTPTASGSLALALDGYAYSYGLPTGWTALSTGGLGSAQQTALSDASTPISMTFTGYNPAPTLACTLLFGPATPPTAPTISPSAGVFTTSQTISMSATVPIRYTVDGTLPNCSSTLYVSPFVLSTTTQVNGIGCPTSGSPSGVSQSNFVIGPVGDISRAALGPNANLNGYIPFAGMFPDISAAPVDANSDATMSFMEAQGPTALRADISIPYNVVDSAPGFSYTTPLSVFGCNANDCTTAYFTASDATLGEGDVFPYPIPPNIQIEGNPPTGTTTGDNHSLLMDKHRKSLHEFWVTTAVPGRVPFVQAISATSFDLTLPNFQQRPWDYTSADASGMAILPFLPTYDDVMRNIGGDLGHPMRMTFSKFGAQSIGSSGYGWLQSPCSHSAAQGRQDITATNLIYYCMILRLKASFDISSYPPDIQVILRTAKRWGFYLADLGNAFDNEWAPDIRWDLGHVALYNAIPATNLEVVAKGTMLSEGSYPSGTPPTILDFTASPSTVALGSCTTVTFRTSGASFSFIDKIGFGRTGDTFRYCPTSTTTLTLVANGRTLVGDDGTGDGTRVSRRLNVNVTNVLTIKGPVGNLIPHGNIIY